jgi:DNA-binding response OmpR family regulator
MEVLVVDDNLAVADSLALLAEVKGHRATIAYNGKTALAIALSRSFDLLLLDENLPDMSGTEVCSGVLDTPSAARPYIVSVTGDSDFQDGGGKTLFDACLDKPFPYAAFEAVLNAAQALAQNRGARPADISRHRQGYAAHRAPLATID